MKIVSQHTMQKLAKNRLKCANCNITIDWVPILMDGRAYCCVGCTDGGPCSCDYEPLPATGERFAIMLHHSHTVTYLRS